MRSLLLLLRTELIAASGGDAVSRRIATAGSTRLTTLLLVFVALLSVAGTCTHSDTPPAIGTQPPTVAVTINGVPDDMNDLLVVPPTGFVVNVSYQPVDLPINFANHVLIICSWAGGCEPMFGMWDSVTLTSAAWQVPAGYTGFSPGTYTIAGAISDTDGNFAYRGLSFAVRDFPGSSPIGQGQKVWFDFDHDSTRDFSTDLEVFGLGSPGAPALSASVESDVISDLLATVSRAYHEVDPNGVGAPDPVAVSFFSSDPGGIDVTRICVGGTDPSGAGTIGNILIDANNVKRASTECGSIPPTGIFPSGLFAYQSDPTFQESFDPLRSSRGGTPVGEHPLDAIVLGEFFDPLVASPEELQRHDDINLAVERLAAALGTILAHETGHALGLVPPAAPGIGLYGGDAISGAKFAHAVTPTGGNPAENYIMKAGNTFSFSKLGGFNGEPTPTFRPLNFAYLRDRAIAYMPISELLPPPLVFSVEPPVIDQSVIKMVVTGDDFSGVPVLRLASEAYTYQLIGEALVTEHVATGWVIKSQIPSGTYTLEIMNSDGQVTVLADAVVVP